MPSYRKALNALNSSIESVSEHLTADIVRDDKLELVRNAEPDTLHFSDTEFEFTRKLFFCPTFEISMLVFAIYLHICVHAFLSLCLLLNINGMGNFNSCFTICMLDLTCFS